MCLSLETTIPGAAATGDSVEGAARVPRNYRRLFLEDSIPGLNVVLPIETAAIIPSVDAVKRTPPELLHFPSIIELDWIIFDVKQKQVLGENSILVNPGEPLNIETTRVTGVTQAKINQEGHSFESAIKTVSAIYHLLLFSFLTPSTTLKAAPLL